MGFFEKSNADHSAAVVNSGLFNLRRTQSYWCDTGTQRPQPGWLCRTAATDRRCSEAINQRSAGAYQLAPFFVFNSSHFVFGTSLCCMGGDTI